MTPKIDRIDISHHRLALDPPFVASWDSRARAHFDATIVRVHAGGLTGIGSGDAMAGFDGLIPLFLGEDALALDRHNRVLANIDFHAGRPWPLDLALWDLAGKIARLPVWQLLGGRSRRIRAYASSGTLRDAGAMAEAAERFAGAGFGAMKIRFHRGDWRADIAALEAVRARLGDRLALMVDCNQGWRMPWDTAPPWTLKDALQVARALEPLDIFWMEEPLHRADRAGMRALRGMTPIRIAGAEMARSEAELRDLIIEGCLDIVQPDAALSCGITGLRRVAAMAEAHGVVFTPHTWTNGLGMIANAHLAAGATNAPFLEFPFDPPEWSPERRDYMLATPVAVDADGWIDLGEAPGFGVELDEDRLAANQVA